MAGFRQSTLPNYNSAWVCWGRYLRCRYTPLSALTTRATAKTAYSEFLSYMATKKDMSTSSFLVLRSALSSLFRIAFEGEVFGNDFRVNFLTKKMRLEKPRRLSHKRVFDVSLLLNYYRTMDDNASLSDAVLQSKVATMLIMYIQLRPADMLRLDMSQMEETGEGLFLVGVVKNAPEFCECVLTAVHVTKICPVQAVLELWHRVQGHRKQANELFWNAEYTTPLTKFQLERGMRALMTEAGIPDAYTPYTIKHAAITFLLASGVDPTIVKKNARLSIHTNTAEKHYFVGEANKIAAKALTGGPLLEEGKEVEPPLPVSYGTDERDSSSDATHSSSICSLFPTDSESLAQAHFEPFVLPSFTEKGIVIIPSTVYDEMGGDFSLFSSTWSVLSSVQGRQKREVTPSGCKVQAKCGEEQLNESVCCSRAGSRPHSPGQPPLTPNSGSLVQ
jgi:site-specific recombinase XerD